MTVAIQNKAIDDFLVGPEHIFSILESRAARDPGDAQGIPRCRGAARRDTFAASGRTKVHKPLLPVIGFRLARG